LLELNSVFVSGIKRNRVRNSVFVSGRKRNRVRNSVFVSGRKRNRVKIVINKLANRIEIE
jgi:hypothetical protein